LTLYTDICKLIMPRPHSRGINRWCASDICRLHRA